MAKIWGIAIIVGFLIPVVVSFMGQTQVTWFWEDIKRAPATLLTPALGIIAIVISGVLKGKSQGMALFFCAFGVFIIAMFTSLVKHSSTTGATVISVSSPVISLLALLSLVSIAAGNHVRKSFQQASIPRFLSGIGGCILVALFLIPIEGRPFITIFIEIEFWKIVWPEMLILLGVLVYGIMGIVSFKPGNVEGICGTISLLARILLFAMPIATLAHLLMLGGGAFFITMLTTMLKLCTVLYGLLILTTTGLASWMSHCHSEQAGASTTGSTPIP